MLSEIKKVSVKIAEGVMEVIRQNYTIRNVLPKMATHFEQRVGCHEPNNEIK